MILNLAQTVDDVERAGDEQGVDVVEGVGDRGGGFGLRNGGDAGDEAGRTHREPFAGGVRREERPVDVVGVYWLSVARHMDLKRFGVGVAPGEFDLEDAVGGESEVVRVGAVSIRTEENDPVVAGRGDVGGRVGL